MFSKNIRTVYLYAVCFITLMMVMGGIIATAGTVTDYILQGGGDVWRLRAVINSIAVWIIAAPVFAFHWRQIVKGEAKENGSMDNAD